MQDNCRILEVLACLGLPSTGRVSRLLPGLARFTLTNAFIIGKVRAVPQLAKDSLAGLSQDCFHCLQEVVTVMIMIAVSTVTATLTSHGNHSCGTYCPHFAWRLSLHWNVTCVFTIRLEFRGKYSVGIQGLQRGFASHTTVLLLARQCTCCLTLLSAGHISKLV